MNITGDGMTCATADAASIKPSIDSSSSLSIIRLANDLSDAEIVRSSSGESCRLGNLHQAHRPESLFQQLSGRNKRSK